MGTTFQVVQSKVSALIKNKLYNFMNCKFYNPRRKISRLNKFLIATNQELKPCGTPWCNSFQELNHLFNFIICYIFLFYFFANDSINSLIKTLRILYQTHRHATLRSKVQVHGCQTAQKDSSFIPPAKPLLSMVFFSHFSNGKILYWGLNLFL